MERRAKIIATLGPSSSDKDTIKKLLHAGMDVARINFSHGNHDEHARVIKRLRSAAQELNRPVTILQDLSGPKIRTGQLEEGSAVLEDGAQVPAHRVRGSLEVMEQTGVRQGAIEADARAANDRRPARRRRRAGPGAVAQRQAQ